MRILVVEDERKVAAFLRQALEEDGHAVDVRHDGADGLEAARVVDYDLLVLDDMVPSLSGRDLCRALRRERREVPILMVTARAALEEKIDGLDAGADDYLTKPFSIEEMRARVRALLRRRAQPNARALNVEDLVLNPVTREVARSGGPIVLSAREYALLDYLMRNARAAGLAHDDRRTRLGLRLR